MSFPFSDANCVVVECVHTFLMIMHRMFFVLIFPLFQKLQFSLALVPPMESFCFVTLHPFRISSYPSWNGCGYLLEPIVNYMYFNFYGTLLYFYFQQKLLINSFNCLFPFRMTLVLSLFLMMQNCRPRNML